MSTLFKQGKTWSYPGNLSRAEATAILGFDPGPPTGKVTSMGYITHVDKEKGIITISKNPLTSPNPRSKIKK